MNSGCGRLRTWLRVAPWLVAAVAAFAYGVAVAGAYVFDDLHSVANNAALRDGDWWRLLTDPSAFSANGSRMYRPALLVSFALNMTVSTAPWSLKLGEVLLVVALLMGLRCHLGWLRGGRGRGPAMVGMLFAGALACGSKETGVVLPALLFVQALALRGARPMWSTALVAARDLLPLAALAAGYLVLRHELFGHATVALAGRTGEDPAMGWSRTWTTQVATMGTLVPRGVLQALVPVGLSFDPQFEFRHSLLDPWSVAGWSGLLGLTLVAVRPGDGAPARRMGAALAWLCAMPWIVVPLNMPFAEHRLYGPVIGLAVAVAPLLQRLRRTAPLATTTLWLLATLAFAVHAAVRSLDYRDERFLWRHELAGDGTSWVAWWGLGMAEMRHGDPVAALAALTKARDARNLHFEVLRNYTEALLRQPIDRREPWRTAAVAEQLLAAGPTDPWVHALAADAYVQLGEATRDGADFERAEALALRCLQLGEPKALVFRLAAAACRGRGDLAAAVAHLDDSLARGLDFPAVRAERAALWMEQGRVDEARRELARLQQQAPFDPAVQRTVARFAAPPR
jgi:predicted Zn-dependent protease